MRTKLHDHILGEILDSERRVEQGRCLMPRDPLPTALKPPPLILQEDLAILKDLRWGVRILEREIARRLAIGGEIEPGRLAVGLKLQVTRV